MKDGRVSQVSHHGARSRLPSSVRLLVYRRASRGALSHAKPKTAGGHRCLADTPGCSRGWASPFHGTQTQELTSSLAQMNLSDSIVRVLNPMAAGWIPTAESWSGRPYAGRRQSRDDCETA